MLVFEIEFLTGRYIATQYNDRNRPEWPPHPVRVFSAMVATMHDSDPVDLVEREALEWLQAQGPPEVSASEAAERDVRSHFVWPNGDSVSGADAEDLYKAERKVQEAHAVMNAAVASGRSKKELQELETSLRTAEQERKRAERRLAADSRDAVDAALRVVRLSPEGRQPRTFPSVTPKKPIVHFIWPKAEADPVIRAALAGLASRVTRIGHSSSLVRCALVDITPSATWVPNEMGPSVLRVPMANQLAVLEAEYARHQGVEPRVLPCRRQPYRSTEQVVEIAPVPLHSVFGEDWIVYEGVSGPPLPVNRAADVALALRNALMKHAEEQPPPEVLAGHAPNGNRSERSHVAFVALPFVGHPNADGTLLGIAAILPRALSEEDRRRVYRACIRWEKETGRNVDGEICVALWMGRAGTWMLQRHPITELGPRNLDPEVWVGPARRWGSVTPVVLDRYPGKLHSRNPETAVRAYAEAQEAVAESCKRIGLLWPYRIEILSVSPVLGAPATYTFPPFSSHPGEPARVHVHVRIEFSEPLRGPVILGAGRYRGLGLCRPLTRGT